MKIVKYLSLALVALFAASCEEHVVEYKTQEAKGAFVQIHYFVPLVAKSANYIYKMELDDKAYVNNGAALIATYDAVPSGSVGRWYSVPAGEDFSIKLYQSSAMNEVYSNTIPALKKGVKYNIFVYSFNEAPIVFEHGEYTTHVTEDTGTSCWIKFYNFIFETGEDDPTDIVVQYQYQYTMDWETGTKSEWLNMGNAVAFGETTGWVEMPAIKQYFNSSGYARIDYRAVDTTTGEVLQYMNEDGEMQTFSDYWTAYIGRRYNHVMAGTRTAKTSPMFISQFTAL